MVKKLQALKAKKGFTLVELIVVIAIIAVLAAILVPTMLGYVTNSRVTSANSTAATLKDTINTFIAEMDTKGYPTKGVEFTRADDSDKDLDKWVIKVEDSKVEATIAEATLSDAAKKVSEAYADELEKVIANDYGFKNATANCYMKNRKCVGVVYYAGSAFPTFKEGKSLPTGKDFESGTFKWDDKDGILDGEVIGTAPALTTGLADNAGS